MKKTQKKIFGLLGLVVVATVTVIAVSMPGPEASATSTVTDTVEVRVVGSVPDVAIKDIKNGAIYTGIEKYFEVLYENANTVVVTLTYTDLDGNTTTKTIDELAPDYEYGSEGYIIRFTE